jgi:hypothetical protein
VEKQKFEEPLVSLTCRKYLHAFHTEIRKYNLCSRPDTRRSLASHKFGARSSRRKPYKYGNYVSFASYQSRLALRIELSRENHFNMRTIIGDGLKGDQKIEIPM